MVWVSYLSDRGSNFEIILNVSGNTYPKTVVNLSTGRSIEEAFYYSQASQMALTAEEASGLTPLTITDVTWSGAITVTKGTEEGTLRVTADSSPGTGYLEVTDIDGITHCFVVNVGRGAPDTEVQEGGYMWLDENVVLGFGNPGIPSPGNNNIDPGVLQMRAQINNGFTSKTQGDFREPMCFAAMATKDGKPAAVIAEDVMKAVENVRFSLLTCRNTDGTSNPYPYVEWDSCRQVDLAESTVKPWTNYLRAGGQEPFKGLVGMSFDLPDTKNGQQITRRISLYILTHNTYMGEEILVEPNIETAAQLNVILSSYDALKTWIKAEYPKYADVLDRANTVNIRLPKGKLTDTVVVSETIADFPFYEGYYDDPNRSNPNFRIYIQGNKTTLAGLISRGSLGGIMGIDFQATEGVTMTYGDETFTCGLMADSQWSGEVKYDMTFAAKYRIDPTDKTQKRNVSDWNSDMRFADCDILSVDECSFEGFDYGTRSTPNGYVGSGRGNSFHKCFYGIYIDCPNKPGWGEITYTGFEEYDFKKNVVAVRIKALQNNVSAYEFRIHDCDFINNYLEFWIDNPSGTPQNYYFYRNHYSGGWNKPTGQWYKHGEDTLGNETVPVVSHRGPKYHPDMMNGVEIFVSASPCSTVANLASNQSRSGGSDGYWIYSGADQVTRIEQSGDVLPIAQEALESLEADADVSVVTNNGSDTVAVWTFEGGA